jgi:hypothetical protein
MFAMQERPSPTWADTITLDPANVCLSLMNEDLITSLPLREWPDKGRALCTPNTLNVAKDLFVRCRLVRYVAPGC